MKRDVNREFFTRPIEPGRYSPRMVMTSNPNYCVVSYVSQKSFKKANEIACKEAIPILKQGTPIVFDGNFYWKSQVDDLIERLDFPHYVFTLKAPLEVCIDRDSKRNKTHGEIAVKVVHKKSTEFDYGTLIDVTKPLQDCINEIISYLTKP